MTPRRALVLTATLGALFTAVAAILFFAVPADALGPFRWGIGLPFLVVGLVNLALAPRFRRETLPDETSFLPLDDRGEPAVGSALVQTLARTLDRELGATPHQVETSTDAVRVSYDSGIFDQPGSRSLRRFRWRTTLAATPDPRTFVRLDQEVDQTRGALWGKVRMSGGLRWSAAGRVTVGPEGAVTKSTVSTDVVSAALKTALAEAGARQATSTMTLVGLVNVGLGVLVALGASVSAAFL